MLISLEASLAVGKTSLLQVLSWLNDDFECRPEPISDWTSSDPEKPGALDLFYKDPKANFFPLQHTILDSIFQRDSVFSSKIVIAERAGGHSAYNIFTRISDQNTNVPKLFILSSKYLSMSAKIIPSFFLYLRAPTAEFAFDRMQKRNRECEREITLGYMKNLHDAHEDWLIHDDPYNPFNFSLTKVPVLCLDMYSVGDFFLITDTLSSLIHHFSKYACFPDLKPPFSLSWCSIPK